MSKMTERRKLSLINKVIKDFDFTKVHKTMVIFDWKWFGHVPEIPEMKSTAQRLLHEVLDDDNCFAMGTGGFEASKRGRELTLSFCLTENSVYLREDEV